MRIGRQRRANAVLTLCGLLLAEAPARRKRSRFENPEGGPRRDFGAELGMAGGGARGATPGEGGGLRLSCLRAGRASPPAPSTPPGGLWRSPRTALTLCGGSMEARSLSYPTPSPHTRPIAGRGGQRASSVPSVPHTHTHDTAVPQAGCCPLTPRRAFLLSLGVLHLTGLRQPQRGRGLKGLEAAASDPWGLRPGLPSLRRRGARAFSTCPGEERGRTHAPGCLLAAGGSSALCHGRGGGWRPLGLCVRKRKGNN